MHFNFQLSALIAKVSLRYDFTCWGTSLLTGYLAIVVICTNNESINHVLMHISVPVILSGR